MSRAAPFAQVQNRAGRRGVPTARSFDTWVRAALGARPGKRCRVNVVLFARAPARALNRQYRAKDYATNVLSFPYEPLPREKTDLLGDLVICPAVVAREAREQGKRVRDHFAHLTVHGVLHLLGFDHENPADAARMERREVRILAQLGIGNPYE